MTTVTFSFQYLIYTGTSLLIIFMSFNVYLGVSLGAHELLLMPLLFNVRLPLLPLFSNLHLSQLLFFIFSAFTAASYAVSLLSLSSLTIPPAFCECYTAISLNGTIEISFRDSSNLFQITPNTRSNSSLSSL